MKENKTSSINNNNNNNEDRLREVESRFVRVYELTTRWRFWNELLQTPIKGTNLSTITVDSQTIERRRNEKIDARDICRQAIQSIMRREITGAYSRLQRLKDSFATPSVITNRIVPMEKIVKLERLDEENLK